MGQEESKLLYNAFMATINKGDEVIIPAPYWVSYPDMVLLARGNTQIISVMKKKDLKLTAPEVKKGYENKENKMAHYKLSI